MIASLFGLFIAQDLQQPVKYRTVAKEVAIVLKDFEKMTGVDFEIRGLANTPVIISSRGMPLRKLMDRIAEVTDSKWSHEREKYVLSRTPTQIADTLKKSQVARGTRLREELLKDRSLLPLKVWTDEDARQILDEDKKAIAKRMTESEPPANVFLRCDSARSPIFGILREFIRKVPPALLGAVPTQGSVVYSNAPGKALPMPVELNSTLGTYLKNRGTLAKFAGDGVIVANGRNVATNLSRLARQIPASPEIAVTMFRNHMVPYLTISLAICDGGRVLESASVTEVPFSEPFKPAYIFPKGHKLSLSLTSKAITELLRFNPGRSSFFEAGDQWINLIEHDRPLPPQDLRSILAKPAEQDPQSFFASEWMLACGDALGKSVVCALPDRLAGQLFANTLDAPWARISEKLVTVEETESEFIVKPTDFAIADASRVDRKALQTFLAPFAAGRFPTLGEQTRYAEAAPEFVSASSLDTTWIRLFDPGQRIWVDQFLPQSLPCLRFLGSLDERELKPGESSIEIANLDEKQFGRLAEFLESSKYMFPRTGLSWSDEPIDLDGTEIVPRSLARNGKVIITRKVEPGVIVAYGEETIVPMTAHEAGVRMGLDPANAGGFQLPPKPKTMQAMVKTSTFVMLSTENSGTLLVGWFVNEITGNGAPGKLDDLLSDLRDSIAKAAKAAAKVKIPTLGNSNPPPPQPAGLSPVTFIEP